MKILAIRGENIASLEGAFEIDFTQEPLSSAGIFAISGPTGAGKSTLLDTMCLALFGCTPRTEQARENKVRLQDVNDEQLAQSDPRFLLRRGTASGYAEVDFVAIDGHRFRARWAVARAREKENGRLKQAQLSLWDLEKGEEISGTRSELQARIVELIGLTFDQFTRSVLLAQNDFSTFLKADQGEKALLLEKLTGTEQYSALSRLIFEKNAQAKVAFEEIQRQIQGIELLPDEAEQALHTQLDEKEREVRRWEQAKAEQQKLQEAFRTAEQFLSLRQRQQQEVANRLEQATKLLEVARRDYEAGVEEQRQLEQQYHSLQQEIQRARLLDVQLDTASRDLEQSKKQWTTAAARRQEAAEKHQAAQLRLKQTTDEVARLKAWQGRYQAKARIAEQLAALQLHLNAALTARNGMETHRNQLASLRQLLEQLDKQRHSLQETTKQQQRALEQTEQECRQREERLKATDLQALEQQMEQLRQDRERLLLEQARWAASGDVLELRKKLQEGQPCPVCGSLHHPFAEKAADVAAIVSAISRRTLQMDKLEKQKKQYRAETDALARIQQQLIQKHKELTDNENAYKEITAKQQLAVERQKHEEAALNDQAARLQQSLAAANLLFGNSEWQQGWQQDPVAFGRTLERFARQWKEHTEALHRLEQQASALQAECASLASFLPSLTKQEEEAKGVHEKQQATYASLRAERQKLLGGQSADGAEQAYQFRMEQLKARLKRLLDTQNEQHTVAEQTRGIAEQIARELSDAAADLSAKRDALATWEAAFRETAPEGQTVEQLLDGASRERTELAFRLRTQAENRGKVSGLQKVLDKRRTESERWAKLNDLVGSADGAKFRRIAQGYTLDVLLGDANVQLRALSRRYRLERVPGTLALQVVDQDMCDEVRSVHSLSGGESFLVSLALALGLSSLSSNRMKVESLFIDEGFGALDAETLRVAMDALESLHTQGRKIGVISHVQEMTERIAVRIQVHRMGNGRSYIEVQS